MIVAVPVETPKLEEWEGVPALLRERVTESLRTQSAKYILSSDGCRDAAGRSLASGAKILVDQMLYEEGMGIALRAAADRLDSIKGKE